MENQNKTRIVKDLENKKLLIQRSFEAGVEEVWKAWTESHLLDQWWAPKPWKSRTKTMDFSEGGRWLYAMVGPDGTEAWCKVEYKTIIPNQQFTALDAFCDVDGKLNTEFPSMLWKCEFHPVDTGCRVDIEVSFDDIKDLEKIVEMGFEEGFTAAHGNLDEIFAARRAANT